MGGFGDIGLALDFVGKFIGIAKFPVLSHAFGHDLDTFDKGHNNNAHVLGIDLRGVVEFVLSFDVEFLGCFGKGDDPVSGIADPGDIGIDLQGIKGPAFETGFQGMGRAHNHLVALTGFFQKIPQGPEIFILKILGCEINKIRNLKSGFFQYFQKPYFFRQGLLHWFFLNCPAIRPGLVQ
jgi:hypothetical protein